jgi:hypothetical protein
MCGNKKVFAKTFKNGKIQFPFHCILPFLGCYLKIAFLFFGIAINFWQCKNGGRTSHTKQPHTQRPTI